LTSIVINDHLPLAAGEVSFARKDDVVETKGFTGFILFQLGEEFIGGLFIAIDIACQLQNCGVRSENRLPAVAD
jgi:hypothetical protein